MGRAYLYRVLYRVLCSPTFVSSARSCADTEASVLAEYLRDFIRKPLLLVVLPILKARLLPVVVISNSFFHFCWA